MGGPASGRISVILSSRRRWLKTPCGRRPRCTSWMDSSASMRAGRVRGIPVGAPGGGNLCSSQRTRWPWIMWAGTSSTRSEPWKVGGRSRTWAWCRELQLHTLSPRLAALAALVRTRVGSACRRRTPPRRRCRTVRASSARAYSVGRLARPRHLGRSTHRTSYPLGERIAAATRESLRPKTHARASWLFSVGLLFSLVRKHN